MLVVYGGCALRAGARAAIATVAAASLAACASTIQTSATSTSTGQPTRSSTPAPPPLAEVLAVPMVGRFDGRCAPGARWWKLRFVDDTGVDDLVYSALGHGRLRRVDVRPGDALTWRLAPGAYRSHEPADPLTNNPETTVVSTLPLRLTISQGSEPHFFRIDARIALAAAIGDTTNCALVATQLRALSYFNGGQPSIP